MSHFGVIPKLEVVKIELYSCLSASPFLVVSYAYVITLTVITVHIPHDPKKSLSPDKPNGAHIPDCTSNSAEDPE